MDRGGISLDKTGSTKCAIADDTAAGRHAMQTRSNGPSRARALIQPQALPGRGCRGKVWPRVGERGNMSTGAAARSCSGRRAASSTLKPRAAAWRAAAAPIPEDAPVTTAHDLRSLAAEACAAESRSANIASTNACTPQSARTLTRLLGSSHHGASCPLAAFSSLITDPRRGSQPPVRR